MSCNCSTTWGTRIFQCSSCYKLNDSSVQDIKDVIEKFVDDLLAQLGPPKGSINMETFWSQQPTPPGTSIPRFKIVSRYCTSNDWFRVRNFNLIAELDDEPIDDNITAPQDCTPVQKCAYPPHWIGYWWINETTCNCVGPVPPGQGSGQFVGPMTSMGEAIDLNGFKTVPKYLHIKAEWEQQSGRNCGATVDQGQTPPQPSGPLWISKYKLGGKTLNLIYTKYDTLWQQEVENTVDHTC